MVKSTAAVGHVFQWFAAAFLWYRLHAFATELWRMTVHFDTLDFMKTLTSAGIEQPHAEAIARAHAKSLGDLVTHDLATKADLKVLKAEIKSEIDILRAELKSELHSEITGLGASLRSEFQTEIRSLRYGAIIAAFALSAVVVLMRFI